MGYPATASCSNLDGNTLQKAAPQKPKQPTEIIHI